MLPSCSRVSDAQKMKQIHGCASSPPACGSRQEGRDPAASEGPLDGPEKKMSIVPVADTDTHMGQVITQATQLLVPIGAIFMRTFVLFLRFVFPLIRRGCFHGCRDCKTANIGRDKARSDGMLKVCL